MGIPIGNLTSQVLANMYLNEFDRYVRNKLKPLAYIRYGDDFLIFSSDKQQSKLFQHEATVWLYEKLNLKVHKTNNLIFKAKNGTHFLGHIIYANGTVIDKTMQSKIKKSINIHNVASYTSMKLSKSQRKELPWYLA